MYFYYPKCFQQCSNPEKSLVIFTIMGHGSFWSPFNCIKSTEHLSFLQILRFTHFSYFFFLFPGHSLTQFVRHCADHFLNSEHKEIRMEAARTCSRLLTPSIHLISGQIVSQTAVQVVADVLSKLLVVGITDPGKTWKNNNGVVF